MSGVRDESDSQMDHGMNDTGDSDGAGGKNKLGDKKDTSAGFRIWGPVSGLGLLVMTLTTAIDQGHKWWMLLIYDIKARGRVAILPFFDLVYAKNTGVSYGLLANIGQSALTLFALAVVVVMAWWLGQNSSKLVAWGLGLVMGGALGNAIDRVTMGGVADFFQLHAFGYSWYVFNIADTAIVAGVVLLLYDSLVVSRNNAANPS